MDNNRITKAFYILLFIVAIIVMVASFACGRNSVDMPMITTEVRVDTIIREKPVPYKVEVVREVKVPVYVQVPTAADTIVKTIVDSVLVEVPVVIEQREYKDSLYRAIVSGAVIGDIHPTLESMEVYVHHETKIVERKIPFIRPYISGFGGKDVLGLGAGVEIKGHHGIGADYFNYKGDNAWAIRYQYKF